MSTESTAPQGRKVFFEEGKPFCYDQGKRVYLEDPELFRQAQAAFKEESERRWFDVCQQCGTWREYRPSPHSFSEPDPEFHDKRFFEEFHQRRCSANVIHSNAKEVQSLPEEKRWRPESCPDCVPFTAAWLRHNSELETKLLGTWNYPRYAVRECFTFFEQGRGRYMNWLGVDPDEVEFTWHVRAGEWLIICPQEAKPALLTRLAPPGGIPFELITYTVPYGHPETTLRLHFPPHQHLTVFQRPKPGLSWPSVESESERMESASDVLACRLTTEYVTTLLHAAADFKVCVDSQVEVIRDVACAAQARRARIDSWVELWSSDPPQDHTGWVMLDRLFRVLRHVQLAKDVRLAGLYARNAEFRGRVVGVDVEHARFLEDKTLSMPEYGLSRAEPPTDLPLWVHWNPSACVSMDGTPASHFELSLLRNWTTELFSFGCFCADGIVDGGDAIFGARRIRIPEALFVPGDLRPLVAVVNGQTREDPFLPSKPEGIQKTGRGPFALVEWHSAHQPCNPCHLPHGVTSIRIKREWYRGTQLLWDECQLLRSDLGHGVSLF